MEPLLWKDVLSAALIASGNSIHWLLLNDHDKKCTKLAHMRECVGFIETSRTPLWVPSGWGCPQ